MPGTRGRKLPILVLVVLVLLIAVPVLAQSGGSYDLGWSSIVGGGGTSTGGSFSLGGTIGEPDAGQMAGGVYTLSGGFLGGDPAVVPEYRSYLPLIMR